MKSITIIRHAESNWNSEVLTDFDRPLNDRGFKDAELMGNILAEKKYTPDMIISSSAIRAITTAKIIADQIQFNNKIIKEGKIYRASSDELFNMIMKLNDTINSIVFVGHNPTLHILSEYLSSEQFIEFPECSIVKVNFEINSWSKIQSGNMEYFLFPRLYKNSN